MTWEQMQQRRDELRTADPHGRMSDNEIDRVVLQEDVRDRIDGLTNLTEAGCELRSILRDMLEIMR